jgi:enoyl-CoA hydratase/carnithine racemase
VDRVLDDVEAGAAACAAQLAALGPLRARVAKQAIRGAVDLPPADARSAEARLAHVLARAGGG